MTQGKLSLWQQHWPWSAHNTARKTLAQLTVRHEWEALGHFYGASSVTNRNQFAAFTPDFIGATVKRILNEDNFADGATFFQVLLKHPRHRDLCIETIAESFATDFADDIFENASDFIDLLADMPSTLKDGPVAQLAAEIARTLFDHHAAHSRTFSVTEFEDLGKLWGKLNHLAPNNVSLLFREKLFTQGSRFDIGDAIKALEVAHEGNVLKAISSAEIETLVDYCTDQGLPSSLYSILWFKAARNGIKEGKINPYKSNGLDRKQYTLVPVPINDEDNLSVLFRHHAEDPAKAAVIDNFEHPNGDDTRPMVSVGNISMPDFLTRFFITDQVTCPVEIDDKDIDILARITSTFQRHAAGEIGTPQTRAVAQRVLPVIEAWCNEHGGTIPAPTPKHES